MSSKTFHPNAWKPLLSTPHLSNYEQNRKKEDMRHQGAGSTTEGEYKGYEIQPGYSIATWVYSFL